MTTDALSGLWTYSLEMARGLAGFGVAVTLVVLGPAPTPDQTLAAAAVPGLELRVTGLPVVWAAGEAADIREAGAVVRGLARGHGVDLVHLNMPALACDGGFDVPVVGVSHGCRATWWSAVRDGPLPEDARWRSQSHWQGLLNCAVLVAPTDAFAECVARTYEMPRPFVVHNGRRPPQPRPGVRREREVFTAGALWDPAKNLAWLDAAAAKIDAPVIAAGPTEIPGGERIAYRNLWTPGRLPSAGVRDGMARAGVFVSTALYEPFGLSVLEAAQAGCPLVLSDIPTFRELWEGAAVLVPPGDVDGLAGAVQQVLDDPARAARLGAAAATRAGRYSIEAMISGMLDIYRMLAPAQFIPPAQEAAA